VPNEQEAGSGSVWADGSLPAVSEDGNDRRWPHTGALTMTYTCKHCGKTANAPESSLLAKVRYCSARCGYEANAPRYAALTDDRKGSTDAGQRPEMRK
jgi:DNA-directed RNA polymerase subunit RPC12/RpoP